MFFPRRLNMFMEHLPFRDMAYKREIGLSAGALAGFLMIKILLLSGEFAGSTTRLALWSVLFAATLFCTSARMSELTPSLRIMLRGIVSLFIFYLLIAAIPVNPEDMTLSNRIEANLYRWGVPFVGLAAMARVAFVIPFFVAAKWQKVLVSQLLLVRISPTDYTPLVEVTLFLALGSLLYIFGKRLYGWWQSESDDKNKIDVLDTLLLTSLAVHFANYFYSGLQKLLISDPWWQWVWENPTYKLVLAAWESGALPLTLLGDNVTAWLLNWFLIPFNGTLNAIILAVQLLSIVALVRIRWALVLTVFYDVTHIVIFLVSGIFFYKWIWLNLLFVAALALIRTRMVPKNIQIWLVSVLVFAPYLFFVAILGWFDTSSLNDEHIVAVTDTGKEYRVPSNYFMAGSIAHGQQRFEKTKPGHFTTGSYGATSASADFAKAQACLLPLEGKSRILEQAEKDSVTKRLKQHHAFVLKHLDTKGRFLYDVYPHHIFSMPWEFQEFYELDKRRIVSYRYVVDSKCLSFKGKRPSLKILLHGEYNVAVK